MLDASLCRRASALDRKYQSLIVLHQGIAHRASEPSLPDWPHLAAEEICAGNVWQRGADNLWFVHLTIIWPAHLTIIWPPSGS
jgi:hypothetical protein